jgi:hypothetical protein
VCRHSALRPEASEGEARGPGVAGGSGGCTVGVGVLAWARVARENERRGGGTGSDMGRRAVRGTHSASGIVVAGYPDAEMVAAARGGTRRRALERGPDDTV